MLSSLLKWLLIGYFRSGYIGLGDCPAGLGNWPSGARNRRKATVKGRCHERDYNNFSSNKNGNCYLKTIDKISWLFQKCLIMVKNFFVWVTDKLTKIK